MKVKKFFSLSFHFVDKLRFGNSSFETYRKYVVSEGSGYSEVWTAALMTTTRATLHQHSEQELAAKSCVART